MNRFILVGFLFLSEVGFAQTQVQCKDYLRAGGRRGVVTVSDDTVAFKLSGIELWGADEDISGIDLVTTDGRDVSVASNEPGAEFKATFPKSQCQFDGKSTLCRSNVEHPTFSYWPFSENPRREVTLTIDSYDTTAVLASGRISLLMQMHRPNGTTNFQSISFSCN